MKQSVKYFLFILSLVLGGYRLYKMVSKANQKKDHEWFEQREVVSQKITDVQISNEAIYEEMEIVMGVLKTCPENKKEKLNQKMDSLNIRFQMNEKVDKQLMQELTEIDRQRDKISFW